MHVHVWVLWNLKMIFYNIVVIWMREKTKLQVLFTLYLHLYTTQNLIKLKDIILHAW